MVVFLPVFVHHDPLSGCKTAAIPTPFESLPAIRQHQRTPMAKGDRKRRSENIYDFAAPKYRIK